MFEREIRDVAFIKRWSIVRTLRDQSVSEHSYNVTMYTNDICVILGLPDAVTLAALRYALWHDVDEIFSGDVPGPNKRALLGSDARPKWDGQLWEWLAKTFGKRVRERMGLEVCLPTSKSEETVKLVVKLADWLDAAMEMATEVQFGNTNCISHVRSQMLKAEEAVVKLADHLGYDLNVIPFAVEEGSLEARLFELQQLVSQQIPAAQMGESKGPHVADASL